MDLKTFFEKNNVHYHIIEKPETIHTADSALKAGLDLNRVTKSLVFLGKTKHPLIVIIPGNCKADFKKVQQAAGSKVHLVPFNDAEQYSGYEPGATPFVHHKTKIKVFIDKKLRKYDKIFSGDGTRTTLLEMKTEDVIKLNNAQITDLTEDNASVA